MTLGIYRAELQAVTIEQAKTGTPQLAFEFVTQDIQKGGDWEPCPNLRRTIFRPITDKSIEYVVQDLRTVGYDRNTFDDIDPSSPTAFDFQGIEITVECYMENDQNGNPRERWRFSNKRQGRPLEQQGVAKLNALFGKHLQAARHDPATAPPRPPQARVQAAPAGGDDEIPF